MNSFIKVKNDAFVDELDVKKAFEMAETKLSVLNFKIPSYVMEFTLNGILSEKTFSHLNDIEKSEIIKYIMEYY